MLQVREEVSFTKGRIIVRGKLVTRGQAKRADYVLYFKPNIPLALIEAKDNSHSVGDGIQQMSRSRAICRALITLDVPKIDGVAITMQPQGDKPRLCFVAASRHRPRTPLAWPDIHSLRRALLAIDRNH
jgi:type I site-specific restriction endonuclease